MISDLLDMAIPLVNTKLIFEKKILFEPNEKQIYRMLLKIYMFNNCILSRQILSPIFFIFLRRAKKLSRVERIYWLDTK